MTKLVVNIWKTIIILLIFMTVMFIGINLLAPKQTEQDLSQIKKLSENQIKKKVIFIMADSLTAKMIDTGLKEKQLPALQFLIKNGQYYKNLVSSFPSMSINIDSTLLTGVGPDKHHIPGLIWYSSEENRIINYGTGNTEVIKDGVNQVLEDSIIKLNQSHLSQEVSTIYEDLAMLNQTSGSINGLIYRGKTPHYLTFPAWLSGTTSLPKKIKIFGPNYLSYGAFSNPLIEKTQLTDDITKRLGFNNQYALETVKYLIKNLHLPDFLFVYLPDMDQEIHEKGPNDLEAIIKLDQELKSILDSFGKWDKALEKTIFIIAGDSGQTEVFSTLKNPIVNLHNILKSYKILASGEDVTNETEIVLAVNERMSYIYPLLPSTYTRDIVNDLRNDTRIDHIVWKENEWIHVVSGGITNELLYKSGKGFTDQYNQQWQVFGDLEVLNINADRKEKKLTYGDYPNALSRLAEALDSHPGNFIIVTAKPGYELVGDSSPTHIGGGSHGSLHKTELLTPLIITGTKQKPKYLRMEDLKPFILDLLK